MKTRLLYNGLYGAQLVLGLAFQVMFARTFGASETADTYFAVVMMVAFVANALAFASELFTPFYLDLKVHDPADAQALYRAALTLSAGLSIVLVLMLALSLRPLSVLFGLGFDAVRREVTLSFALVLMTTLCVTPLVALNTALLNAEHRFAIPYALGPVIPLFNIVTVVALGANHGLTPYALAPLLGGLIVLGVQQFYLARHCGIRFRFTLRHPQLRALAVKSLSMRMANQIHMLREPLTLAFIARLPEGSYSLYTYAQKIMITVYQVATAPILQIYFTTVAASLARGDLDHVRTSLGVFRRRVFVLLAGAFVVTALGVPSVLQFLYGEQFNAEQRDRIYHLVLLLMPLYTIGAMDQVYSTVVIASKRSLSVMKYNLTFIVIFVAALYASLLIYARLESIPIALSVAQIGNFLLYRAAVARLFREGIPPAPNERK